MNLGYEDNELQPYQEPEEDFDDDTRIRKWFEFTITRQKLLIWINVYRYYIIVHIYRKDIDKLT